MNKISRYTTPNFFFLNKNCMLKINEYGKENSTEIKSEHSESKNLILLFCRLGGIEGYYFIIEVARIFIFSGILLFKWNASFFCSFSQSFFYQLLQFHKKLIYKIFGKSNLIRYPVLAPTTYSFY